MPEFTGSTEECLADFFRSYDWPLGKKLLAEFTEVGEQTVRCWRLTSTAPNGNDPLGKQLLKVRVFLDMVGYNVKELDELPDLARRLGKVVAFGILTLDEVREKLDYRNSNEVYGILLRGTGLVVHRQHRMQRLVESHADAVKAAAESWKERLVVLGTVEKPGVLSSATPPRVQTDPRSETAEVLEKVRSVLGSTAVAATTALPNEEESPTRRHRERLRHSSDPAPVINTLGHLIQAMDNLLSMVSDKPETAKQLRGRVSPQRIRTVRFFLDEALKK